LVLDPPALPVLVSHDASTATISLLNTDGTVKEQTTAHISGSVSVSADRCKGGTCAIHFFALQLNPDDFSLGGDTLQGGAIGVAAPLVGTLDSNGFVSVPQGANRVFVRGKLSSDGLVREGPFPLSADITGRILPSGQAMFRIVATNTDLGTKLDATVQGTFTQRPPHAVAAFPRGSVECTSPTGALIPVDASGSYDPDGDTDLQYSWAVDGVVSAGGVQANLRVPLGTHTVELIVNDSNSTTDTVSSQVVVVDTTPPEVISTQASPECLWPPNHKLALFRLGEEIQAEVRDACDPAPRVFIQSVGSSQDSAGGGQGSTTPDVLFGTAAACFRAERQGTDAAGRIYTLTLAAEDSSHNRQLAPIDVAVPHDQRGPKCRGPTATLVEDGDPRCTANLPDASPTMPVVMRDETPKGTPESRIGCSTAGGVPPIGGVLIIFAIVARRRRVRPG